MKRDLSLLLVATIRLVTCAQFQISLPGPEQANALPQLHEVRTSAQHIEPFVTDDITFSAGQQRCYRITLENFRNEQCLFLAFPHDT